MSNDDIRKQMRAPIPPAGEFLDDIGEESSCRHFDPWSCDEGPDGEKVDRDLCMVCGLPEGLHA